MSHESSPPSSPAIPRRLSNYLHQPQMALTEKELIMCRIHTQIVAPLLLACCSSCVFAQGLPTAKPQEVGVSPKTVKQLSSHLQSLVDQGLCAGGVTLMARKGKVIHFEALGKADLETWPPMRKDAIFRIASMTKPVTSVAAMILYEQGRIDLLDPVHKYIPEFRKPMVLVGVSPRVTKPAKREITIRDLLTHQSGLIYAPYAMDLGALYIENEIAQGLMRTTTSLDENMRRLGRLPLLFSPGDRFQYGLSTDVLGRVVEKASGKKLNVFLRDHIFEPLEMTDTHFILPPAKLPRLVAGYELTDTGLDRVLDGELRVWKHGLPYTADYAYRGPQVYLSGGAGLCSTTEDYARFCQMLLNGGQLNKKNKKPLLKPATVKMMMTNQIGDHLGPDGTDKFGLGFGIITEPPQKGLEGLVDACWWAGAWSTGFTVSPRGDWYVISMRQTFTNDRVTPEMSAQFERIAARSILQNP